uniref:Aminoglycoside phosphotransferase domain-containing protein n=1 Tax=Globisporangium ultimum (strain ATCC 200006 / CBS 805.95 / DAOM BR144) TaxID=431595 RepID=K3WPY2_GLOUD
MCWDSTYIRRALGQYPIYTRKKRLPHGRTYLQSVRHLSVEPNKLDVILTPLGFEHRPLKADDGRYWDRCMLTALRHWHGMKLCHGDVQWRNMIYVPKTDAESCYWVLTDIDESYPPQTKEIDWDHQREGEILDFSTTCTNWGSCWIRSFASCQRTSRP